MVLIITPCGTLHLKVLWSFNKNLCTVYNGMYFFKNTFAHALSHVKKMHPHRDAKTFWYLEKEPYFGPCNTCNA